MKTQSPTWNWTWNSDLDGMIFSHVLIGFFVIRNCFRFVTSCNNIFLFPIFKWKRNIIHKKQVKGKEKKLWLFGYFSLVSRKQPKTYMDLLKTSTADAKLWSGHMASTKPISNFWKFSKIYLTDLSTYIKFYSKFKLELWIFDRSLMKIPPCKPNIAIFYCKWSFLDNIVYNHRFINEHSWMNFPNNLCFTVSKDS